MGASYGASKASRGASKEMHGPLFFFGLRRRTLPHASLCTSACRRCAVCAAQALPAVAPALALLLLQQKNTIGCC